MHKRFDDIFSALMLAAAVAVVIAGAWCLSHSIERAKAEHEDVPVADVHIGLPQDHSAAPLPTPTPIPTPDLHDPEIPLSPELQVVLRDACEEYNVPMPLALGLIEVESGFQEDAVSTEGCYGLCQLNPRYFPDKLSPADNIQYGIRHLGGVLEQYGDTAAVEAARKAAIAEMTEKVDKAKDAKKKAEEKRKAAEESLEAAQKELAELKAKGPEVRELTQEEKDALTAEAVNKAKAEGAEQIRNLEKQLAAADPNVAEFKVRVNSWQKDYQEMIKVLDRIAQDDVKQAARNLVKAALEQMT